MTIDPKVLAAAHNLTDMQSPWLESVPPIAMMFARALIAEHAAHAATQADRDNWIEKCKQAVWCDSEELKFFEAECTKATARIAELEAALVALQAPLVATLPDERQAFRDLQTENAALRKVAAAARGVLDDSGGWQAEDWLKQALAALPKEPTPC